MVTRVIIITGVYCDEQANNCSNLVFLLARVHAPIRIVRRRDHIFCTRQTCTYKYILNYMYTYNTMTAVYWPVGSGKRKRIAVRRTRDARTRLRQRARRTNNARRNDVTVPTATSRLLPITHLASWYRTNAPGNVLLPARRWRIKARLCAGGHSLYLRVDAVCITI